MIVHGARLSPFIRKVIVFAAEKGIAIEVRPAGFGRGADAYLAASPFEDTRAGGWRLPAVRFHGDHNLYGCPPSRRR